MSEPSSFGRGLRRRAQFIKFVFERDEFACELISLSQHFTADGLSPALIPGPSPSGRNKPRLVRSNQKGESQFLGTRPFKLYGADERT